jgi:hypothetical protein
MRRAVGTGQNESRLARRDRQPGKRRDGDLLHTRS